MRSVLHAAAFLPLVAAFPQTTPAAGASQCKVVPGDSTWPAAQLWTQSMPNAVSRGAQTKPTRPDYRVEAVSVQDVQNAVSMAAKYNVRLSVITTGHDGLGRNDAPSGIALAMERLKGIRIEQKFTASAKGADAVNAKTAKPMKYKRQAAASTAQAVTFGAGISTQELNDEIAKNGLYTMGAEHGEVSVAGGWGQCAGHGPMTSFHGLGADNVLEYQVVTADGKLTIANSASNPDLFWALRGGCGSTFGVVVQATVKAYPSPKFTVTNWCINATDADGIYKAAAIMHAAFPDLNSKGVAGYYNIFAKSMKGIFHQAGDQASQASSKAAWAPVLEKMAKESGIMKESLAVKYTDFKDYKTYFDANWGAMEAHGAAEEAGSGHAHGGGMEMAPPAGGAAGADSGHSHGGAPPSSPSAAPAPMPMNGGHSHGGAAPAPAPVPTAAAAAAPKLAGSLDLSSIMSGLSSLLSGLGAPAGGAMSGHSHAVVQPMPRKRSPRVSHYRSSEWWGSNSHVKRHGPESGMDATKPQGSGLENGGDSRLMSVTMLNHPGLAAALKAIMPTGPGAQLRGALIAGPAMAKMGADTSVHPSWRKAYSNIATVGGGAKHDVDPLAALDPTMGAYINEGSWKEADWKKVFWGDSYAKLSTIKTKYDPQMVFWVTPGINADMMQVDEKGRLCKSTTQTNSKYPPLGDNQNMAGGGNHGADMAPFPVLNLNVTSSTAPTKAGALM